MTPLAHGIGHGPTMSSLSLGESLPVGFTFWTLSPAGAVSLTITLLTDGDPIYVRWGDDSGEWVEHNTPTTHEYAEGGTYELQISTPERLTSFVNADSSIAFGGTVDTTNFTALTVLKIRKASISSIGVSASTLLETLELNGNALTTIDVSANVLLKYVRLDSNSLTAGAIDDIVIDLDDAEEESGTLNYGTQVGDGHLWANRSADAKTAQYALEAKTWTITPASLPPGSAVLLCHFDNNSTDATGRHTLTPSATVNYPSGVFSQAACFAALGKFDISGNLGDFNFCGSEAWCIEGFIKDENGGSYSNKYLYALQSCNGSYIGLGIQLKLGSDGSFMTCNMQVQHVNSGVAYTGADVTKGSLPKAGFHYAVTWDGTKLRLYIEEELLAELTVTLDTYVTASALVDYQTSSPNYVSFDEIRIWRGSPIYTGATYTKPSAPFAV